MSHETTLKVIFFISIAGVLFSGYLSYLELFAADGCNSSPISCGDSGFTIADLPACVYGFFMYLLVLVLSAKSLIKNKA